MSEIGYGREITDNVRGFITVRVSSLRLGTTGRFFEGGHPIDFGKLMARNVVFEIEDVGDDRDKAFLMGTVLIQLTEHLRLQARTSGAAAAPALRHLSVFEEAHRLLRRPEDHRSGTGATAHAVEMFAGLLAEIRAYGEGLIIAEQIPAKIIPDAVKNTAVKIVHRLPAADDREMVGATMNMTDAQSRYLVTLPPGQAAVFTDGMDYPVLAAMPDGTAREAAAPAATASPAGHRVAALGHLRAGLPGHPLHAARHAGRATDPRRRTWSRPLGRGSGPGSPDRMAHAGPCSRQRTRPPDRCLVRRRARPGLRRVPCGGRRGSRTSQYVLRAGQRGRTGISRGGGPAPVDRGRRTGVRLPRTAVAGPRFSLGPDPG